MEAPTNRERKSPTPPDRVLKMLGAGGMNSGLSCRCGLNGIRWRGGAGLLGLGRSRCGL
jgi:hypothetical protein